MTTRKKISSQKLKPKNEERAHRAERALAHYEDDPADNIRDLLTDLRHYCAREGVDFPKAVTSSAMHFEAEPGR